MKRSTASWSTAIAASALLALPVGSWAQQAPSASPRPQTTGGASSSSPDRGTDAGAQKVSANEHLRQAEAALADIPAASLTGTAQARLAELKRRINMLEQPAQGQTSATGAAARGTASWSTDVAAVDRILTELLGSSSTTGATEPAAAGTSGSTASKSTPRGAAAASATLGEPARAKLQEVRTHITAFAASMSGTNAAGTTRPPSSAGSSSPSSASATTAPPTAATAGTTGTSESTAPVSSSASATAAGSASTAATTATPQGTAASAPGTAPQQVDTDTVKRHLTAARETLSQLTQLPAAAQLTGDARTQVSQLISNFNELITTNTDWRASYAKVQANLAALVGDQKADESAAAPATGTAGAVGTSGTTAIDANVRAKLIELRTHLTEFEKMAGGASTAASTGSAPASAAPAGAPATGATATTTESAAATASPTPTGTSGRASEPAATAGTSGTTPAEPTSPATAARAPEPQSAGAASAGKPGHEGAHGQAPDAHHRAMTTHIDAIEAILNGQSATAGTTGAAAGKTTTAAGASSLDRTQIEQIRKHLNELRAAMAQAGK